MRRLTNEPTLMPLYTLNSTGIFGFFMGVPVFNAISGVAADIHAGRKLKVTGKATNKFKTEILKAAGFSSAALFFTCACSAYLTLRDPFTAANLKWMLLIVLGGAALLRGQYFLLMIAGNIAYGRKPS